LADENDAGYWKTLGIVNRGCLFALAGEASKTVEIIASGIAAWGSMGSTVWIPLYLCNLAMAYGELDQFADAWRCISDAVKAVEMAKETCCEAEIHRTAGEIELLSPALDPTNAEAYFERALAIACKQQAKSWELRAAMSMARLWCDQGKRQQAHDLLAPVYRWFLEGFDTLDLKEAKTLLEQLKA
jgi:predicted ATPase